MDQKQPSPERVLEMNDGDVEPEVKKKAYVNLGFTSPGGERYTGGSW